MKEWDMYWEERGTDCLPGHENSSLKEKLDEIWGQALISSIDKSKAFSLVDLATGGGYLSSMIDLISAKYDFKVDIYSTDASQTIMPIKATKSGYKLLLRVYNEALPFANNSIDLLVSNFGFEYSNLITTIRESSRILKPKAKMILNLHYKNSLLTEKAWKISKAISVWQNCRELIELENSTYFYYGTNKYLLRDNFKKYFDKLHVIDKKNEFGISECGLLEPLLYFMKKKMNGENNLDESFLRFKSTYEQYRIRLLAQVNAALSDNDLKKLGLLFQKQSMDITNVNFIEYENRPLSVCIQAIKHS